MKRGCGILCFLSLMVAVGVAPVGAAIIAPSYESSCHAENSLGVQDDGPYHARAGSDNNYAESMVQGWGLGSQAHLVMGNDETFSGSTFSFSQFSQPFSITDSGKAWIEFSYEGSLLVSDPNSGLSGEYTAYFYIIADDTFEHSNGATGMIQKVTPIPYGDIFYLNYDFSDEQVGEIFTVTLTLETGISSEKGVSYSGQGHAELVADFYNTGQITGLGGGIQPLNPVPIPASVWLLATGLAGLMGIGIRRRSL